MAIGVNHDFLLISERDRAVHDFLRNIGVRRVRRLGIVRIKRTVGVQALRKEPHSVMNADGRARIAQVDGKPHEVDHGIARVRILRGRLWGAYRIACRQSLRARVGVIGIARDGNQVRRAHIRRKRILARIVLTVLLGVGRKGFCYVGGAFVYFSDHILIGEAARVYGSNRLHELGVRRASTRIARDGIGLRKPFAYI